MSGMGQTEKNSERADIFRSSTTDSTSLAAVCLAQAEGNAFLPYPIFRKCPLASTLPARDLTRFSISLPVGNWIASCSFVIDDEIPFAYERPLSANSGLSDPILREASGLAAVIPPT